MDMGYVCPKECEEICCWERQDRRKWAAKHKNEEVKEEIWLEDSLGSAAKEDKGRIDRQASQHSQKIGAGRRLGPAKTLPHWLVG